MVVALGAFVVYLAAGQRGHYWSDGRFLLEAVELGRWRSDHIAYLPLAHAARALWAPFSGDGLLEPALLALSAAAGGTAVGLVHRAARLRGISADTSLAASTLAAAAPSVFFFSTCIEVHALQLAASAGIVARVAGTRERKRGESALLPVVGTAAVTAAHNTGVLWAPALGVLTLARRRGRALRHVALALFLAAALGGLWALHLATGSTSGANAMRAVRGSLVPDNWSALVRELLRPLGVLAATLVVGLGLAARAALRRRLGGTALAGTVLVLGFVPLALSLWVGELGAYFISLVPPLVLATGLALDRVPGPGRRILLATLVLLQLVLGLRPWYRWQFSYPGHTWAEPLLEETPPDTLWIAASQVEAKAVWRHSRRDVVVPLRRDGRVLPSSWTAIEAVVNQALARGRPVALSRALAEEVGATGSALLEAWRDELGVPDEASARRWLFWEAGGASDA